MTKLTFDDGRVRLDINGNGMLVFNPSDFNVYERFYALIDELPQLEKQYAAEVEIPDEDTKDEQSVAVALAGRELIRAKEIDALIKSKLSHVFGSENDFDKLLGGVNIMAFGSNGERIITNFLNAIIPYIESGLSKHTGDEVAAAHANREQRRAAQKKGAKK